MSQTWRQPLYLSRTVRISGIAIAVSTTEGALLIWGQPHHRGQTLKLNSASGKPDAYSSFALIRGRVVAIFPLLPPGDYWTSSPFCNVSIRPNYVLQVEVR